MDKLTNHGSLPLVTASGSCFIVFLPPSGEMRYVEHSISRLLAPPLANGITDRATWS